MSDPNADEAVNRPVRLIYKIIAYVAIWILALLLTAPGLWPLAWMFPLGLVAVIDRHTANASGWAVLIGCYAVSANQFEEFLHVDVAAGNDGDDGAFTRFSSQRRG
jgi:apolipoprotein N-acyltransferase